MDPTVATTVEKVEETEPEVPEVLRYEKKEIGGQQEKELELLICDRCVAIREEKRLPPYPHSVHCRRYGYEKWDRNPLSGVYIPDEFPPKP